MAALANHRRELFAQLLVQGFTAVDAYAKAGYRRHDGNASTLANHPEVLARLEEIRGELDRPEDGAGAGFPLGTNVIAAKANLTAQDLINMQDEFRQLAKNSRQCGAGLSAVKEMSILSGVRVERAEIGGPGEFDHMSDDELLAALRERFAQLDRETRLAISVGSIALNGVETDTKE